MTIVPAVDPPASVATIQESTSVSNRGVISHVESLFQSFAKSLEVRFSSIEERLARLLIVLLPTLMLIGQLSVLRMLLTLPFQLPLQ